MGKRICLFAGFNAANRLEGYVLHLLRGLARHADLYCLSDDDLPPSEHQRLKGIVKKSWSYRHGKYDFGSWQEIIRKIGWSELERYDSLLLVNDSNYGPLFDLEKIFSVMDTRCVDAWGITASNGGDRHLQSYFLCLSKNFFLSPVFKIFIEGIEQQKNKLAVSSAYELGLSRLMRQNNFSTSQYIENGSLYIPYHADITSYQNSLLDAGSPFIKRKVFFERWFAKESLRGTYHRIKQFDYPCEYLPVLTCFRSITSDISQFFNIKKKIIDAIKYILANNPYMFRFTSNLLYNLYIYKRSFFMLIKNIFSPIRCGVCASSDMLLFEKRINKQGEIIDVLICPECHLLSYSQVMDVNQQKGSRDEFYSHIFDESPNIIAQHIELSRSLVRSIIKYIDGFEDKIYLDYGCGAGFASVAAAEEGFAQVYGVDVDIQLCKRLCACYHVPKNIQFYNTLSELPQKADVVILWQVIEHIDDPYSFFCKLNEYCVKHKTQYFIQFPQYDSRYICKSHCSFYNEVSIRKLFNRLNWTIFNIVYDYQNAFMTVYVKNS